MNAYFLVMNSKRCNKTVSSTINNKTFLTISIMYMCDQKCEIRHRWTELEMQWLIRRPQKGKRQFWTKSLRQWKYAQRTQREKTQGEESKSFLSSEFIERVLQFNHQNAETVFFKSFCLPDTFDKMLLWLANQFSMIMRHVSFKPIASQISSWASLYAYVVIINSSRL